jgi:hypothetical protein
MADAVIGFDEKGSEQYKKIAREVMRRMMNPAQMRGRWQQREGGGGGDTIWFTIDAVLCPETDYVPETTLVVTATWYTAGCSKTPPGANDDGKYYVYDLCSYLSGLTVADLTGGVGRATYHYPLTGDCEPRWIIDDLCPSPECA